MSGLPSGTVTFLFTDVEGSTRLLQQLGNSYDDVLADHEKVLKAAFAAHDGRVVDTQGDSFFVAFARAKSAVEAAADAQRRLADHAWPDGATVKVRMGMHTGEPRLGEERYVGLGVNKAARIGAAAHGGQVLLSRTTRELVEDELPPGVGLRDLGERRLKDIDQPERIFQLVVEGIPSEFGELRTLDVELRRGRRRLYTRLALIGLVAAGLAIAVVAVGRHSGADATTAANSVAVIDPRSDKVVGSIPVGIHPTAIAVGAGSVWVANTVDETVTRIDARSRQVKRTVAVGEYPSDVSVSPGFAWVAVGGTMEVRRIVPAQSRASEALPAWAGAVPFTDCTRPDTSLAAGGGWLWFVCGFPEGNGSYATRIDPRSGGVREIAEALVSSSALGPDFSDVTFGLGSAWLVDRNQNVVTQIEASSLRLIRQVAVGSTPSAAAIGSGWIWVANTGSDSVSRFKISGLGPSVSQTTSVVAETIEVGDAPVDVAAGEGAVWVVNSGDRTIMRIDPKTEKVVATIELDNAPVRIAAGEGAVWVTVQQAGTG